MRSAEDVVDEVMSVIANDFDPDSGMAQAKPLIEADRIEAQLEALRELLASGCCHGCCAPCPWHRKLGEWITKLESARAELKKGGGG